jgi:hypothetical protein
MCCDPGPLPRSAISASQSTWVLHRCWPAPLEVSLYGAGEFLRYPYHCEGRLCGWHSVGRIAYWWAFLQSCPVAYSQRRGGCRCHTPIKMLARLFSINQLSRSMCGDVARRTRKWVLNGTSHLHQRAGRILKATATRPPQSSRLGTPLHPMSGNAITSRYAGFAVEDLYLPSTTGMLGWRSECTDALLWKGTETDQHRPTKAKKL